METEQIARIDGNAIALSEWRPNGRDDLSGCLATVQDQALQSTNIRYTVTPHTELGD